MTEWFTEWLSDWSVRVCVYQCMSACDWWTDGRTVTDWRTDGRTHGLTDGRADGRTDMTDWACECARRARARARARVCVCVCVCEPGSMWGLVRVSVWVCANEWACLCEQASERANVWVSESVIELTMSWPQLSWFGVGLSQLDWVKDRAGESVIGLVLSAPAHSSEIWRQKGMKNK